jgi:endonuclease-8
VAESSPQGRFASAAAVLDGRVLHRAEALGKHLFHVYTPELVVHVHLGLYGAFTEEALPVQPPRGQVRMRLVGPTHWTDLRGPTVCELVTEVDMAAVGARLGPDPLRRDADPHRAWARISRSRAALATLLMDQSVLAGVGKCVLWLAPDHPSPLRTWRHIGIGTERMRVWHCCTLCGSISVRIMLGLSLRAFW